MDIDVIQMYQLRKIKDLQILKSIQSLPTKDTGDHAINRHGTDLVIPVSAWAGFRIVADYRASTMCVVVLCTVMRLLNTLPGVFRWSSIIHIVSHDVMLVYENLAWPGSIVHNWEMATSYINPQILRNINSHKWYDAHTFSLPTLGFILQTLYIWLVDFVIFKTFFALQLLSI